MKIKYSLITLAIISMGAEAQTMVPEIDKTELQVPVVDLPAKPVHLSEKERHALALAREWKNNPDKPHRSPDGRVTYLYGATLPTVICAVLQVCAIHLQAGEVVNNVHIGDTARWHISPAMIGAGASAITSVIVKPWHSGLTTMLIVTTNLRSYTIKLVSTKNESTTDVSFAYPDDQKRAWETYRAGQSRVANATTLRSGEDVGNLDFKFTMSGDSPAWKPERVFRDRKGKTHIQFSSSNFFNGAPALVVIGKGGGLWSEASRQNINYRPIGDTYVVDGQPERMALVMGVGSDEAKVDIEYNGGKK